MLGWALTFLVIALIAAALGFGGVAGHRTDHLLHLPGASGDFLGDAFCQGHRPVTLRVTPFLRSLRR